jgi:hypothetical protein
VIARWLSAVGWLATAIMLIAVVVMIATWGM